MLGEQQEEEEVVHHRVCVKKGVDEAGSALCQTLMLDVVLVGSSVVVIDSAKLSFITGRACVREAAVGIAPPCNPDHPAIHHKPARSISLRSGNSFLYIFPP
jgi:hypothetical protein